MIPVSEPSLHPDDLAAVSECLMEGWVSSSGPHVAAFEKAWASYCGRQHGIAVSSGTAALEIAVAGHDLADGDEILIPSFTIISCAIAVVRAGGVPVLVDCDARTWCLDVDQASARITRRTRAIMAVDMYGHPAEMDALTALAERHGLVLIEDAAQAHGAQYLVRGPAGHEWRRCGSFGQVSCFSFYANKLLTTGEGGMIVTDDAATARRARASRDLCRSPDHRFRHEALGFSARMTSLQAAFGLPQLPRMEAIIERKRHIAAQYRQRLGRLEGVTLQAERDRARSVFWMNGLVIAEHTGLDSAQFAYELRCRGIETRPFFVGMH